MHEIAGGTYVIVHKRRAQQENTRVVGELDVVELCTIEIIVRPVIDVIFIINEPHVRDPVPGLLRPVAVRVVPRVACEARPEREEAPVRDGVLVVVAVVEGEDLPLQAAAAGGRVPAGSLGVEHGLCEGEPLGLVLGGVLEVCLGSGHGCEAPETWYGVSPLSYLLSSIQQCHTLIIVS